ncbi:MAG TPA: cache domain-containing protein, partial [Arenibaculum sp.]|nr:cache domain-containing protein [Arenibaculum sp.]
MVANLIGLCLVAVLALSTLRQQMFSDRQADLSHLTEAAVSLVGIHHERVARGLVGEAEAKERALNELARMRYEGTEYFFTFDNDGVVISHGGNDALIGRNMLESPDADGKLYVKELVDVALRQGGGEVHYMWVRPGDESPSPKISYSRHFEPWGWVIATGVHVDDIDEAFS